MKEYASKVRESSQKKYVIFRRRLACLSCNNLTSLTGLEKLVAVYGNMEIYYNPKLSNYCTLKLTTFNGTAYISSNAYNPTYAEIKAGKCSN
jgi:hypothetical protein